ncbi:MULTISPECIES: cytochrome c biogenesis heme-transporting ATPase CcmA [Rheinheimera]|uniref:Cytochrome c biogenesis heme-transporting ATPase CcmA n=1 Tax=Rheinheimera marina TaxID=1774958 RepID=A0ABV9JR96_9GAMM
MSILLSAEQLSCVRQDRVLFDQLSFDLPAGQVLHIQGKNGAGKSSLLRILAGLADAETGQVRFRGLPITSSAAGFSQHLLFIGHQAGIHSQLNALQNLEFWAALLGCSQYEPYQLLGQLGLAGLEDIPCYMLSAGQQRRVSLARLWLTERPLWILDEPFTSLDKQLISRLEQQLQLHCSRGGAVVLTSHQALSADYQALAQLELQYRW